MERLVQQTITIPIQESTDNGVINTGQSSKLKLNPSALHTLQPFLQFHKNRFAKEQRFDSRKSFKSR